jgi:ABC-type multidrug transport system fused ATPase/permease subunit
MSQAVYREPPVLIFDEATSVLDSEAERGVKSNMDRLLEGRTAFVIAHRLTTIRDADLICVPERGQIVEQGTHEELLRRREEGRPAPRPVDRNHTPVTPSCKPERSQVSRT